MEVGIKVIFAYDCTVTRFYRQLRAYGLLGKRIGETAKKIKTLPASPDFISGRDNHKPILECSHVPGQRDSEMAPKKK